MSKERTDPSGDARNPLNKQANNRTKKNQKHLKYALSLIFGVVLGLLLGNLLYDNCLARYIFVPENISYDYPFSR